MENSIQTTPWLNRETILISFMVPITLALQLGTGGNATGDYHRLRLTDAIPRYYAPANNSISVHTLPQTSANEVRRVLDVFKLPITEFATYVGVSRTAVYDWMGGRQIGAANAEKLQNYAKAADVIVAADLQMSPLIKKRKLAGGKTLFEAISDGADGEQAAHSFVVMLNNEANRRKEISARFGGRKGARELTEDAPAVFSE